MEKISWRSKFRFHKIQIQIQISLTCLRCLSHVKSFAVSLVVQITRHRTLSSSFANNVSGHNTIVRRKSGYFTVADGRSPAEHLHFFGGSSYYRPPYRRNDFAASASGRAASGKIRVYVLCLSVSDLVVLVTMTLRTIAVLSPKGKFLIRVVGRMS